MNQATKKELILNLGDIDCFAAACAFVDIAFKHKTDRAKKPLVHHLYAVANNAVLMGADEEQRIIALLHDAKEIIPELWDLIKDKVSERIRTAVDLLTHDGYTLYMNYIVGLSHNSDALLAKLADLKHNMDISRFEKPLDENDIERLLKYHQAYLYLTSQKMKSHAQKIITQKISEENH